MTRKEAIIARRAVRTYTAEPLKDAVLAELRQFIGTIKPLHSTIKTNISAFIFLTSHPGWSTPRINMNHYTE